MGNVTSNSITSMEEASNSIMQTSTQVCSIESQENMDFNTIIVENVKGGVTVTQVSSIDNARCDMSQALNVEIKSIIDSMLSQSASAMNGFSLDFSAVDQNLSIYQTIRNSVTQQMNSTCNIGTNTNFNNNYFFAKDVSGGIKFAQSSELTSETCNMSNIAKTAVYNSEKSSADQKSSIVNIFSIMFTCIGICLILGVIFFGIFLVKGGLTKTVSSIAINPAVQAAALSSLGFSTGGNLMKTGEALTKGLGESLTKGIGGLTKGLGESLTKGIGGLTKDLKVK